jgi:hypothetical protein
MVEAIPNSSAQKNFTLLCFVSPQKGHFLLIHPGAHFAQNTAPHVKHFTSFETLSLQLGQIFDMAIFLLVINCLD